MSLVDSLRNLAGTYVATTGNSWRLPEMGASEWISGSTYQNKPLFNYWGDGGTGTGIHTGAQKPGSVLGATYGVEPYTSNNTGVRNDQQYQYPIGPQPNPNPTGAGGGGGVPTGPVPVGDPGPLPGGGGDPLQDYRNTVMQTYGDLEGRLDPWRADQERGVNNLYNSSLQDINLQKKAGLDSLTGQRQRVETNQIRNLKDLSNAIGQSFNTFSNQLGVMGAGDSSAAKTMLPYALSRMEAQQRGGITRQTADAMGGIDEREGQLNNLVMSETNKLNQARMQEMNAIADWFNNAKFQISQMRGQDVRGMAENALNQALQRANEVNQQYTNRQNALRDWATSTAQNIGQLRSNLNAVSDPRLLGNLPQFTGVNAQMTGYTPMNYSAPAGLGFTRDEQDQLFR